MRTKLVVLVIIFAGLTGRAAAQPPQPAPPPPPAEPRQPAPPPTESYVIGPQDNLSIIVTDENDLTGKNRVDTDGTISMPYLQRVPVAGLTLAEAQSKITTLLKAG
jgi:polysaccharide export outer membrane protein